MRKATSHIARSIFPRFVPSSFFEMFSCSYTVGVALLWMMMLGLLFKQFSAHTRMYSPLSTNRRHICTCTLMLPPSASSRFSFPTFLCNALNEVSCICGDRKAVKRFHQNNNAGFLGYRALLIKRCNGQKLNLLSSLPVSFKPKCICRC
ncbi:hypothetical protein BU24DRAFT_225524 [Aaosphaeria arxii CBS 175.79]|uniref:Uncharacterized protein n=1 Tax=Aaosphaeria arxii CBS 175.79 TaxID=1450172 RepID=A0A6A5XQE2_9PLEO|nr:uncharacterized protein BU24DRAFT_225524 [Aaosphaeria arxii CBS 175.79]KAF2014950.1 hypothetical protein BU24DRAFT_225524 [Aaosphaeria arxii CBS 175.79]